MIMDHDGEFFVDTGSKISPRDTWHDLTLQQLLEVESELLQHWSSYNKTIRRPIQEGLEYIRTLIAVQIV